MPLNSQEIIWDSADPFPCKWSSFLAAARPNGIVVSWPLDRKWACIWCKTSGKPEKVSDMLTDIGDSLIRIGSKTFLWGSSVEKDSTGWKQAASGLDRMGRMGQWHHILDYWKIDGNEQQQTCLFPTRKNQCYQQTKEKCPFAKHNASTHQHNMCRPSGSCKSSFRSFMASISEALEESCHFIPEISALANLNHSTSRDK